MFPSVISEISNSDRDTASQKCTNSRLLSLSPGRFPTLLCGYCHSALVFPHSIILVLPLRPERFPILLSGYCHSALDVSPFYYLGTVTQSWMFLHSIIWVLPLSPGRSPLYYLGTATQAWTFPHSIILVLSLSPGCFPTLLSGYCHSALDVFPPYYLGK
jgi:hypothetical protein